MAPDNAAVLDLADRLRTGGWCYGAHVSMAGGGLYLMRSVADRRVARATFVPKRGPERRAFRFADPDVDVDVPKAGPIVTDAPRAFETLEALAAAVLAHDRALAEEREWRRAAPAATDARAQGRSA